MRIVRREAITEEILYAIIGEYNFTESCEMKDSILLNVCIY